MHMAVLAILASLIFCGPCRAEDVPLSDITPKWVEESLEKIDQFASGCEEGMECATELEKLYSNLCDLLTKKISALCQEQAGAETTNCQKEIGKFLEANINSRMAAGKLSRLLNPGAPETRKVEKIFAGDMILLNAYIDIVSGLLEK